MSLFTAIAQHIASLGAALPSQNARLIRLHTPLGPDALVVERVVIDDAVGPLPLRAAQAANPTGQRLAGGRSPSASSAGLSCAPAKSPSGRRGWKTNAALSRAMPGSAMGGIGREYKLAKAHVAWLQHCGSW